MGWISRTTPRRADCATVSAVMKFECVMPMRSGRTGISRFTCSYASRSVAPAASPTAWAVNCIPCFATRRTISSSRSGGTFSTPRYVSSRMP